LEDGGLEPRGVGQRVTLNPRRPTILTFDCYGTLIDWEAGIAGAFQEEAGSAGIRLNREQLLAAYAVCEAEVEAGEYHAYREVLATAARCAAARLGWDLAADRAGFLVASLPGWRPFADTNPALDRLASSYALGILSNVDDDLLAQTRSHFPVDWDLVVTAEQVRSYKPRHAHWEEARRRMAGAYTGWIHVAQSHHHDVIPAGELGLPIIWVNRRGETLRAGQARPTHEVRTLGDAAELLLAREDWGEARTG
jgi:2-haloalkanoic acid dehalogenase type II